jgi:hypothetical protein
MKETDCCPLISRTSPVTLYSSIVVTHTSPLDTLGCSIDMLEPVSKIRLLDILPISTETVGVPCSNKMETVHIITALSGAFRWKELCSFTPLSHFLDFLFSYSLFHYIWGLITWGTWTCMSKKFAWVPPSRCGSEVNLPVRPCRALYSKVSYPFTLKTPEGSFGLCTSSTQGCWLASIMCLVVPTRRVTNHVLHQLSNVAYNLCCNFDWGERDCLLTKLSNMV